MKSRFFIAIAVVISLFFSAWAFLWGYADINSMVARNVMTGWEQQSDFDEVAWQRAVKSMQNAYIVNKGDASLNADFGRLYAWQALQRPEWSRESHKNREKAMEYYLAAISSRPSWGLGWMMFAEARFLNQKIDQLFFDALEKAMILGPWESDIQQKSLWIGMVLWSHFSNDLKESMLRMIDRALIQQPRYVMETASVFGGAWLVEPLLASRFLLNDNQHAYFNHEIIRLAVYYWEQISDSAKQQIKEIAAREIRENPAAIAKLTVETDASGLIAVLLDGRESLDSEDAVALLERSIVHLGFGNWKDLARPERNAVKKVVKKLFREQPRSVPDIAVKVNLPWLITPLLRSEKLLSDEADRNYLQRQVIRLGLRHWEVLPDSRRKEIKRTIGRAVKDDARGVINIAVENGWGEKITPYLTTRGDLNYLFDRLIAREKEKNGSS